jgi:hypothetical protein
LIQPLTSLVPLLPVYQGVSQTNRGEPNGEFRSSTVSDGKGRASISENFQNPPKLEFTSKPETRTRLAKGNINQQQNSTIIPESITLTDQASNKASTGSNPNHTKQLADHRDSRGATQRIIYNTTRDPQRE